MHGAQGLQTPGTGGSWGAANADAGAPLDICEGDRRAFTARTLHVAARLKARPLHSAPPCIRCIQLYTACGACHALELSKQPLAQEAATCRCCL